MPHDPPKQGAEQVHSLCKAVRIVDNASPFPVATPLSFACAGSLDSVPDPQPSLAAWKPLPAPRPILLRGQTVILEPLDAARHTADLWNAVQGHDVLWRWLGDGPFANEDALRHALETKQADPAFVFFAILPLATGKAAGFASYLRIDARNGVVEVGNILFAPALQRTREATEAIYLMARHAFEDLGYRRYEWKCNAENAPSRRAAQRFGFTFEGIFRQHMVVKGANRDTAWFAMLDHAWPARKHAFEAWLAPANFDVAGRQIRSLEEIRQSL
jgi:RimJ/RimL family protein N-acetyltransferase